MTAPRLIRDIFAEADRPVLSFEFFPPKTPQGEDELISVARHLAEFRPGFISMTYGAGGSTREVSTRMVLRIAREVGVTTTAHLTGIAHTQEELGAIVKHLRAEGIANLLALRGDPPKDVPPVSPESARANGGFGYAVDVVRFFRSLPGCSRDEVSIAVAGYPEKHPEAASFEEDLAHLKEKVEAGADLVVTQLFFDVPDFLAFAARARAAGIRVPIVPGILPITNVAQVRRFTTMCGAKIPPDLKTRLDAAGEDHEAAFHLGVEHAKGMCRQLLAAGVPGIHFYCLNRARSVAAILEDSVCEG